MGCASGPRCIVWCLWGINLLASAVYLGISLVSFHNVKRGVQHLAEFPNRAAFKNSLLASCILGFLIVLFWVIFSFFVLLGRLFRSIPLGYGVMLGSCSHTGFFSLLAGLVLQTHVGLAQDLKKLRWWSETDYQTYTATYVFNYILCGTYMLMFLVLLFTSGAMTDKTQRSESYAAKAPPAVAMTPPATSGTAANVENPNHGFGANWGGSYRGGNV